jgi:hypothetical protein
MAALALDHDVRRMPPVDLAVLHLANSVASLVLMRTRVILVSPLLDLKATNAEF